MATHQSALTDGEGHESFLLNAYLRWECRSGCLESACGFGNHLAQDRRAHVTVCVAFGVTAMGRATLAPSFLWIFGFAAADSGCIMGDGTKSSGLQMIQAQPKALYSQDELSAALHTGIRGERV